MNKNNKNKNENKIKKDIEKGRPYASLFVLLYMNKETYLI
jgi:hypothetical protein